MKLKTRGKLFYKQEWYSICSSHNYPEKDCECCNTGQWINVWKKRFGSAVYKLSPKIWRWWANLPKNKRKWLDSFEEFKE